MMRRVKKWFVGVLAAGALFATLFGVVGERRSSADTQPGEQEAWNDCKFQNAALCSRCHTVPGGNDLPDPAGKAERALDVVLMTEYSIWKTHDKHAQAYAVLEGPRGKKMGELLGQNVLQKETGCLNCHAMADLSGKADEGGLDLKDGVSCGGCHGPSSKWLNDHSLPGWRKKSAEDKFKLGMRDLRDPEVRAKLCMSCHVGNAAEGKVVTHAMMAAGHPPLPPIEIATFSKNEPQHWRDAKDVPYLKSNRANGEILKRYHAEDMEFERTRFAVIGSIVALRESLQLARERADFKAGDAKSRWPEVLMGPNPPGNDADIRKQAEARWPEVAMAHSDCYACHHDLRYPGYRQGRGFGYFLPDREAIRITPGRVLPRVWPTSLVVPCAHLGGQDAKVAELEGKLKALVAACNGRPFGEAPGVGGRSKDVVEWCDETLKAMKNARFDDKAASQLMKNLCNLQVVEKQPDGKLVKKPFVADYESARQISSVLRVAFEEWKLKPENKDGELEKLIDKLRDDLGIEPYTQRMARLEVIHEIIKKEKPKLDGFDDFAKYLAKIDDPAALEKFSKGNDFLNGVRGISNNDFNDGLKNRAKKLQEISDTEQGVLLDKLAKYDPVVFQQTLAAIAAKLK